MSAIGAVVTGGTKWAVEAAVRGDPYRNWLVTVICEWSGIFGYAVWLAGPYLLELIK